jgi:glycosyltransferase involved in cell wall biosynthesis
MADAFIYPSLYEGFGLPVLEAMRCGAPCIISRTSSLPEVGGSAALYFEPCDVDALFECMKTVKENELLANTLREQGFRQAAQFTWKRYALRLHRLFDQLEEKKDIRTICLGMEDYDTTGTCSDDCSSTTP